MTSGWRVASNLRVPLMLIVVRAAERIDETQPLHAARHAQERGVSRQPAVHKLR